MKVELVLNEAEILALVHEIVCLDDAYKLLEKALPAGSIILKDVKSQQEAYRNDFKYKIWEHSNREMVAIDLFHNLEYAERTGVPQSLESKVKMEDE